MSASWEEKAQDSPEGKEALVRSAPIGEAAQGAAPTAQWQVDLSSAKTNTGNGSV